MNKLRVNEKILKTLLESPKTTGEIATKLELIDRKTGYPRYNMVKPSLNTLYRYGYIHRTKKEEKRSGAPATTYDIVYEISVLREILKKYPSLIPDLQKSDKIIGLIWDYFLQRCSEMFPSEEAAILDNNGNVAKTGSEIAILMELISSNSREMFQLSPTYFASFLINESFLESFSEVWNILHGYVEEVEKTSNTVTIHMFYDVDLLFIEAFSYSVITDFINGYGNPEALKFVRKLRGKLNHEDGDPEALEKLNK